jgi:hypothetical protein
MLMAYIIAGLIVVMAIVLCIYMKDYFAAVIVIVFYSLGMGMGLLHLIK